MKTTLKHCISFALKPQGGIYSHQGNGDQGDNPWPEPNRVPQPRFRGLVVVARGASSRARSFLSPVRTCARFRLCSPWF